MGRETGRQGAGLGDREARRGQRGKETGKKGDKETESQGSRETGRQPNRTTGK